MSSHEPVLSKGQYYDSDEEERVISIEINPIEQVIHGSFEWSTYIDQDVAGFIINDSIGNAIATILIKQLNLKKNISLKHNNIIVTDIYSGENGSKYQNFVLVWNISNNSMSNNRMIPIELVHTYNNIIMKQFNFNRIYVIDAINICNLATPLKTYKNDCGLRTIRITGSGTGTDCFKLSDIENTNINCDKSIVIVPKLQENVIVTGLTASLINKADAKSIPCAVVFNVSICNEELHYI